VEAHRSVAFVAGPYVKQGAVVSARYTTVNLIRTMEDVLGTAPLGLNDAMAEPMAEVFDVKSPAEWRFEARVPAVLRTTQLPLPPARTACVARPTHDAAWWAAAMKGQDFRAEDRLDTAAFNRALWRGLRGAEPYPAVRSGADLRAPRETLATGPGSGDCG
jgi:DNA-binding beta-propeller fold protein YncE